MVQKYQKDLEKSRRETDHVKESLMVITESLNKERKESEYQRKIMKDRETDYYKQIEELERKNKES